MALWRVDGDEKRERPARARARTRTRSTGLVGRPAPASGGLVLVEGPAGIGKSRLLAEGRRQAADAGCTCSRRAAASSSAIPVRRRAPAVRGAAHRPGRRERVLAGAAAAAAPIFGFPGRAPTARPHGEATFARAPRPLLARPQPLGGAPLLLAVDDLHWCDRASLRFLAYLARRLEDVPVLLVGSLRPSEPGADQALLGELTSDPPRTCCAADCYRRSGRARSCATGWATGSSRPSPRPATRRRAATRCSSASS